MVVHGWGWGRMVVPGRGIEQWGMVGLCGFVVLSGEVIGWVRPLGGVD